VLVRQRQEVQEVPRGLSWDVFVPGDDLPRRVTTDYVVSEGELVGIDGEQWLVERVVIPEDGEDDGVVPLVYVEPPHEPV
jgi:hypothetical protein